MFFDVLLNMNKIQNDFNKYNNVLKQNYEIICNKNNTNEYSVEVFGDSEYVLNKY